MERNHWTFIAKIIYKDTFVLLSTLERRKAYHSSVIDPVNEILRRKNMKVKTYSV